MTWTEHAARIFEGGHEDRCEARHRDHATVTCSITLDDRPLPDCPASPVGLSFWFTVFAADQYKEPSYCPGDDELSRAVIAQGVWEPWESAVALAILTDNTDGLVLDLGSHVGWYTMLAALTGHDVLAVDADWDHLLVLGQNIDRNDVREKVTPVRGWIDATKPPLSAGEHVRLAKVDLEGGDHEAVRMLRPLLDAGAVDYVLMELSPVFGHDWRSAVNDLTDAGYQGYVIPTKGDDLDAFEKDPLGVTLSRSLDVEMVTGQCSALFCRAD